ncbi:MAG: GNAT family N-acetyltransferase [Alphaproteobacteria bacterium]
MVGCIGWCLSVNRSFITYKVRAVLFIATSAETLFESMNSGALDSRHAKEIAVLHKAQLPQSLICAFGTLGLRAYYKWVAESDIDALVLVLKDGGVAGAATLSLSPQTIGGRAVKGRLWRYAPRLAFSWTIWRKIFRKISKPSTSIPEVGDLEPLYDPKSPELLQIFIAPAGIGQGLGSKITRMIEYIARNKGCEGLIVRTDNAPTNKALAFYLKNDFSLLGSHESNGKELAVYYKLAENLRSPV